jgi:hypothetical protein
MYRVRVPFFMSMKKRKIWGSPSCLYAATAVIKAAMKSFQKALKERMPKSILRFLEESVPLVK